MDPKPHICFVAPYAYAAGMVSLSDYGYIGGAEIQQTVISKNLAKHGYKISMISLDFGQDHDCVVDNVAIIKTHKPDAGLPGVRFFYPRLFSLWKAMKRVDADIYYQRAAGVSTGITAAFCKLHNKKFLFSIAHNKNCIPGEYRIRFKRDILIYEYGLRNADIIVSQHQEQQRLLKENFGYTSVIVPSCYEAPLINEPVSKKKIIWVSTLRKWKRPELFIKLAQSFPQLQFQMIGGPALGKQGEEYYDIIAGLCKDVPNLEFVGFVPYNKIDRYFDEASILINTSEAEGFPNTFLQAWSRGVPVIYFPKKTGIIGGEIPCVVVTNFEELTQTVKKLWNDQTLRKKLGQKGLRYFTANHSVENMLYKYSSLFERLMK